MRAPAAPGEKKDGASAAAEHRPPPPRAGPHAGSPPAVQRSLAYRVAVRPSGGSAPAGVGDVLRSPGEPLPSGMRRRMETGLGGDFAAVRVHADARAAESARALGARAYTIGGHVVFGPGEYAPGTDAGRRLLAHELAHVVQQGGAHASPGSRFGVAPADDPRERAAERAADGVARGAAVEAGPATPRPVIQRLPPTQVGPVFGEGGLIRDETLKRLAVIVGPDDTLRSIAKKLLPMFNQAEPFSRPDGSLAPVTQLTEEQLARGLLVYNRYYLQVPSMTKWKVGLRFPLPVEISRTTGEHTLHPGLVADWAGTFEPEWAPLLDQKPTALAKPTADELKASAETFLSSTPDALARGIHLSARALTNAAEAQPLIDEVFRQLGAGAFDVALQFMDSIVMTQVDTLAGQPAGQKILDALRQALAAAPADLDAKRQQSLARAHRMLDRHGSFTAEEATRFENVYIAEVRGCNCMTAVYKGLKGLYGEEQGKSISSQVSSDAAKVMKATGKDTNHMIRIMETVRARGKAGPEQVFTYDKATDSWTPAPEAHILGMTHPTQPGWYFFGLALHEAYHSVVLVVDKTDVANPKFYWMDQFTEGFVKEVTGGLEAEWKNWKPSYGFAKTRLWQFLPAPDTILELR